MLGDFRQKDWGLPASEALNKEFGSQLLISTDVFAVVRDGVFAEMPAHPELTPLEVRQIVDHVLKLQGTSRRPG